MGKCSNRIDLSGLKYNRLTAISPAPTVRSPCGSYRARWNCICDCGNETVVDATSLKLGKVKSCGCLLNNLGADLTGARFGKLTVVQKTDSRLNGYVVWECLCDCGSTVFVRTSSLTSGNTQSCGCSSIAHIATKMRKSKCVPETHEVTTLDGDPNNVNPNNIIVINKKTHKKLRRRGWEFRGNADARAAAIGIIELETAITDAEKKI